jgi:hypothetical protein
MKHAATAEDSVWKGFYTAALFEDDSEKIPGLIARAESEIGERARKLFGAPGDNVGEMRALDNAIHMLQMLKSCVKNTTVDRTAA